MRNDHYNKAPDSAQGSGDEQGKSDPAYRAVEREAGE
ncbi:unnamed protein product, partial [marine sediment metagenome]